MLARVVSKCVLLGTTIALLAGDAEEDALGGTSLMRGDDVAVAEDILNRIPEAVEAAAAGVAFVALHDRGPLVRGHGSGAGVGEEVDEDIVGRQEEEVVVGGFEELLALWAGGPVKRFDAFDAEGFDDGFDGHGGSQLSVVSCQLSVVSCQLSVVSCQLSVVSCQLSVVSCQLSVVSCRSLHWN